MSLTPMRDLVVLLPGIMGTVLKKDGRIVWGLSGPTLASALLTRGGSLRDSLSLHGDSPDRDELDDGIEVGEPLSTIHILPGVWKIDGYSELARQIQSRFQVTPGKNFFGFGYDWRRDNRVAAHRLQRETARWLHEWRKTSPDAKLVLVAHSMGGLVARYFVEVLEGWRDTRALVTLGTPFRGSLNALDGLANGIRHGPRGLWDLSELARTFTSLYQLLPIYPCYDPGSGDLVRIGETTGIPHVNSDWAADALKFHRQMADAVQRNRTNPEYIASDYRKYPVVGVVQPTLQGARLAEGEVVLSRELQESDWGGDGTVPRVSATPVEDSTKTSEMFVATRHASLQNASAVVEHLGAILAGLRLDLTQFRATATKVGIEVPDLVDIGESITVRALPTRSGINLQASLRRDHDRTSAVTLPLRKESEDWSRVDFPSVPPGVYRVEVTGPGVEPCSDLVVVADPPNPERR